MSAPRPLVLLLLACTLALAACGGDDKAGSGSGASTTDAASGGSATTDTGCRKVAEPPSKDPAPLPKPKRRLDPAKTYVATVKTSCGDFEITLDAERAPKTGGSFASLADQRFYDSTTFHRVVADFVIQGGDPLGNGQGGPGYTIVEPPPKNLTYTRGLVAMAKTQIDPAGASGSQFFVVTGQELPLPPEYALLGKVTGGQGTVDKIATSKTDIATEAPLDPIVIESITVEEK
jgi:cyclophilin family peptidyl-prolyl cis-trans isomerase